MWFKVCNSLCQHRKALEAGPEALGLWTMAGAWSCAQFTNGFIPDYALTRLAPNAEALASRLLQAELWERVDGGYQFHEWSDYQPDAEAERLKREKRREAGRKGGVRSGKSRRAAANADNEDRHGEAKAEANASANAQANTNPEPEPDRDYSVVPPCSPRERFDEFWSVYPVKKSKKAARKSWERALRDADADTIIKAAKRYRDECAASGTPYVKHPTTWLNQGCWDDEPTPVRAVPQMSTADQRISELQAMKRDLVRDESPPDLRSLPGGRTA